MLASFISIKLRAVKNDAIVDKVRANIGLS